MTTRFIMIQAIGFLGSLLFLLSYQCKDNKNLFRVQFGSYIFYILHLLMLGAITGGVSYMVNLLRSFCLGSENSFLKGKKMCSVICILQLAALVFTYDNHWSILPVAANIAATIGGYTYNALKIRLVGMFINSPLWIVYYIIVGSWAGLVDEILSEISMLISIIRYGWKDMDSPQTGQNEKVRE